MLKQPARKHPAPMKLKRNQSVPKAKKAKETTVKEEK